MALVVTLRFLIDGAAALGVAGCDRVVCVELAEPSLSMRLSPWGDADQPGVVVGASLRRLASMIRASSSM